MSRIPEPLRAFARRRFEPLKRWWLGLDTRGRRHAYALALLMVLSIAHFRVFSVYFIEDAGISFAYAKNFVEGHGWVTWPGGERVEGFSNPLWTWLVAFWYAIGVPPWTSSKVMGAVFGAATLPLAYRIAEACRPGARDHVSLLPPVFLAASSTAAIWNASGLENSLFSFLLAGAILQTLRTGRSGGGSGFPWAALWYLGLAVTRPEGVAYAAIGGLFGLFIAVRDRRGGDVARWLVVFWAPFLVYQAWRYSYFAWEFPNTWYAKVDGENRFKPWSWRLSGWKYFRNYLTAFGLAFAAPVYAIAMVGLRDWRRWLVVAATVVCGVAWLWNGRAGLPGDFDPDWLAFLQRNWERVQILALLGSAGVLSVFTTRAGALRRLGFVLFGVGVVLVGMFGLPELGLHARQAVVAFGAGAAVLAWLANLEERALARNLVLGSGAVGVVFILYSGGDWMKQWRFWSYASVPNFVLFGVGLGQLIRALPGVVRPLGGRLSLAGAWTSTLLTMLLAPNIWQSSFSAPAPETSVSDVFQRVKYMGWVQDRLHLEQVTLWDVDMGAHMYYSGWRIMDVAGLVDVPVARHLYQKEFIREYLLEEGRPHFAHMHGGWASKVKITTHPEWKQDYIEIPGYPSGKKAFHVGNHIRKDIFVLPEYLGPPGRRIPLVGGVTFEGVAVPSPEVPAGGRLYLEYWLKAGFRSEDFRVYAVLEPVDGDGSGRRLFALPPGYDWYAPSQWKSTEHVIQRYDFALPEDMGEGSYRLGFLLIDDKSGEPMREREAEWGDGVLWFDDITITLVSQEAALELAEGSLADAMRLFDNGACEEGWEAWRRARYHVWKRKAWVEEHKPEIYREMSRCYTGRAAESEDEKERITLLIEARHWDYQVDALQELAEPLARTLDQRGDVLRADGDLEGAYQAYRQALQLDPTLSWTRRKAEEVRDLRLGIDGKVRDASSSTTARSSSTWKSKEGEEKGEDPTPEQGGEEEGPGGEE